MRLILSLVILLLMAAPAWAARDWSLCPAQPAIMEATAGNPSLPSDTTVIEAGQMFSQNGRQFEFRDAVTLRQNRRRIETDRLQIDRDLDRVDAFGPLRYLDDGLLFEASRLSLRRGEQQADLENIHFTLSESHLQGDAERVRIEGKRLSRFEQVRYSSCDPDRPAWTLSASRLEIDRDSGRGTAVHSVLRLGGIPLLYLPWLQFPIDDRRMSGLLSPTLGQSNTGGTSLSLPLYWNQAPNYDMTLTPTFYSLRGLKLDTENRYLFARHRGSLELATLDDQVAARHRWLERWRHEADLGAGIHARLLYQRVSDSDYLKDFSPSREERRLDWLDSAIELSARPASWQARLIVERYQTLNPNKPPSDRPYERWPQLSLNRLFVSSDSHWRLDWKNQWTRFRHDSNLEGERLWITPRLSHRVEGAAGHIETALRLDHAEYRLDQALNKTTRPSRDIPLLSIDGKLIFERLAGAARDHRQTLEPRLYLLYVPYRDQSGLPDFDTSKLPENLNNLFTDNRFSGGDRVGDSRQISLSLSSRLFDSNNREILSLTLAQAHWLDIRRVSLDGQSDDRQRSPLMGQLKYAPTPQWTLELSTSYDQDIRDYAEGDFALRRRSAGQVFNLEYHLRRDKLEQSTLSFVYPVSPAVQLFGKYQYSLHHRKPVENLAGLAWQSCFWGFKLLYRESSDRDFTHIDRGIFFELTLKGLGSAGERIDAIAETGILGYHPAF